MIKKQAFLEYFLNYSRKVPLNFTGKRGSVNVSAPRRDHNPNLDLLMLTKEIVI